MILSILFVLVLAATQVKDSVSVHFSPTGTDRLLTRAITDQFEKAEREIRVAMYQFTSMKIAQALATVKQRKKLAVRLLVDARSFEAQDGENAALKWLAERGIEIKKVVLEKGGKPDRESPRFHHKFCVIDRKAAITGSYNWTALGDESNYENMVIIESENVAAAYVKEFDRLWNDSKITR